MATIYAGQGKVFRAADTTVVGGLTLALGAYTFQRDGVNGQIIIDQNDETADVGAALFGHIGRQLVNQTAQIRFQPFDNWLTMPGLFPPYLGCDTSAMSGGQAASLRIGGRPHGTGAAHVPTKVWTNDGRIYQLVRTAINKVPDFHLGVGKPLFGEASILAIGDDTLNPGTSGFLFTGNAITESGGADPSATSMTMSDFTRGAWTGVWGTETGFGGDGGGAIQAEDEWTITSEIQWQELKVQGLTRGVQLNSARFMAKCKPYGPTHTNILAQVGAHTSGQLLGKHDLVLTGPGTNHTITLKNTEIVGAGFQFGGSGLGTREIGFVTLMTFTAGVSQPLIVFGAGA